MKILLALLMLSPFAQAQISKGEIKNFNFKYQTPMGDGTADSFSYQAKYDPTQNVHVEKVGEEFKIHLEGVENQDLSFKNPPSLIKEAESIQLSAFNLDFQERAILTMSSGSFQSPDKEIDFKNFNLACDRISTFPEIMDQVLSGCIQKMNLKVGGFSSMGAEGIENALLMAMDQKHDEFKSSVSIKNVDFKVNGGKFQFAVDVKAQISGTVTGSGSVKYEVPLKKVTVKVSEIKFGFLDLTSQVFDQLKKQETASMKVSKPYIYLTIK